MFNVVLYEPEIPPNTGNIIRLCANSGVRLHLVEPLGFKLSDRQLKRAGLDYHEYASVEKHASLTDCLRTVSGAEVFLFSTAGTKHYAEAAYSRNCVLLFGPETRGLPKKVLGLFERTQILRIPMISGSRSLNLANAVAIVVYEAWRQNDFTEA
ncbi:MAG: tRNA (uridine(34)/cytosine(34)/5-carboxymethylaminomethyluridine(34)-2'-O)-methyltransferase TrmL [Proteobacteria bacterium]|nr:tRNA (uridine(34)/cytosine(34)/5-carboxymethylaminomethyluridine(34)-2'-O)-methyltransferase TrmL [Pseudomonadota bacterium]